MEPRALAEQLLGLPPGSLLNFKIFDDHISLILPDGRKITLTQSELETYAASQMSIQADSEASPQLTKTNYRKPTRPDYKYRKGKG